MKNMKRTDIRMFMRLRRGWSKPDGNLGVGKLSGDRYIAFLWGRISFLNLEHEVSIPGRERLHLDPSSTLVLRALIG
jgi:hypothetical protein